MKTLNSLSNGVRSEADVSFRSARLGDIDDIMMIEEESFLPGVMESREVFMERIRIFPAGFLIMNIKEYVGAIGYISSELWRIDGVPGKELFILGHSIQKAHSANGNMLYISSMGILKQYRKNGLGRELFSALIRNICSCHTEINRLILIVGEPWHAARRIYESEGFQKLFTLENFFTPLGADTFDSIVMVKGVSNNGYK
ncbi:MAG: GNAT family N-acetyltransferase [Candidatus Competibacteraceae bacterium]|nr:GNAT family N-acetyltransferase [Candidatus Competibacteraceae bacterium]